MSGGAGRPGTDYASATRLLSSYRSSPGLVLLEEMGKSSKIPRRFCQDVKDHLVDLVEDHILAENSRWQLRARCEAVAPKIDVSWRTTRQWTQDARCEGRVVQHQPEDLVAGVVKLRRES